MPLDYEPETEYDQELADEVLRMIRLGNVPAAFARHVGVDVGAPERWANDSEEFAIEFARAKVIGADVMVHDCITVADHALLKADAKKVMIDARMKLAALWNPERYGPQSDKAPLVGIQTLVHVPYGDLPADKRAAVDKFFGTDDD